MPSTFHEFRRGSWTYLNLLLTRDQGSRAQPKEANPDSQRPPDLWAVRAHAITLRGTAQLCASWPCLRGPGENGNHPQTETDPIRAQSIPAKVTPFVARWSFLQQIQQYKRQRLPCTPQPCSGLGNKEMVLSSQRARSRNGKEKKEFHAQLKPEVSIQHQGQKQCMSMSTACLPSYLMPRVSSAHRRPAARWSLLQLWDVDPSFRSPDPGCQLDGEEGPA